MTKRTIWEEENSRKSTEVSQKHLLCAKSLSISHTAHSNDKPLRKLWSQSLEIRQRGQHPHPWSHRYAAAELELEPMTSCLQDLGSLH